MERWASLAERAASWPNTRTELRKPGDVTLSSGEKILGDKEVYQNHLKEFFKIQIHPSPWFSYYLGSWRVGVGKDEKKNTRMYILKNRAPFPFPSLVTVLNINNLEGCICVWCLSQISAFHLMYASMYVFICHLIPERMADGLKWYIKYQKRSIKNRNKMPKRKKIGNVNVSHPEVTFTKFSWLPFRRDLAHREKIQDSASWVFREHTRLRHWIVCWKNCSSLTKMGTHTLWILTSWKHSWVKREWATKVLFSTTWDVSGFPEESPRRITLLRT